MTHPHLQEIEALIAKADRALIEACETGRITMSIPARPGEDTDLVISEALDKARSLIRRQSRVIEAVKPCFSGACNVHITVEQWRAIVDALKALDEESAQLEERGDGEGGVKSCST